MTYSVEVGGATSRIYGVAEIRSRDNRALTRVRHIQMDGSAITSVNKQTSLSMHIFPNSQGYLHYEQNKLGGICKVHQTTRIQVHAQSRRRCTPTRALL